MPVMCALRDQLVAAAVTINRLSEELSVALATAEEGAISLRARVAELEEARSSALLRLQILETQNAELRKLLQHEQPDLARTIRDRDTAVKKLRLTREVVHDLIEERRAIGTVIPVGKIYTPKPTHIGDQDSSDSTGRESWSSFMVTEAESSLVGENADMLEGMCKKAGSLSERTESTSTTTVEVEARASTRPGNKSPLSATIDVPGNSDSSRKQDTRHTSTGGPDHSKNTALVRSRNFVDAKPNHRVAHCGASRTSKSERVIKTKPTTRPRSAYEAENADSPSKNIARAAGDSPQAIPAEADWYLEYQKPPATAIRPIGPLSYGLLRERLVLDDDTMLQIGSMESWEEPSMQMHIHHNMAFVCHPIVLEGPTTTYLVNWGNAIVNANVKKYLATGADRLGNSVFHLFVKNVARDAWFYVGGHRLLAADMPSIWHTRMSEQDKQELSANLHERWSWRSAPNPQQIAKLIEMRGVAQCIIELQSDSGLQEISEAFVRRYLSAE